MHFAEESVGDPGRVLEPVISWHTKLPAGFKSAYSRYSLLFGEENSKIQEK